jgi:hypothetical protein
MSREIEDRGLCSTCRNAADCSFPRGPDTPVLHCEEFEVEQPSPVEVAGEAISPSPPSEAAEQEGSVQFIGLCSDCENRESCVFPRPEGGVWHCEEYR